MSECIQGTRVSDVMCSVMVKGFSFQHHGVWGYTVWMTVLVIINTLADEIYSFNIIKPNLIIASVFFYFMQCMSSMVQAMACHFKCQAIAWTSDDLYCYFLSFNPARKS